MIKVKDEAIDNFMAMRERSGADYLKEIIDEMSANNRGLFDALFQNAKRVAEELDNQAVDGIIDEDVKKYVFLNVMTSAMALYKTIEIQLEAMELEKIYAT